MRADNLGGKYPRVDKSQCIECGLCSQICPFMHPAAPLPPKECFAAVNRNDELRSISSSGGVFIELARRTITRGGVVFGAIFTQEWSVVHTYAETMEEIFPMMGSKYVQSDTSNTFRQAKHFLEQGREVLYTGTPCQIAGLKHFLGKDYPSLLTAEVICHGTPLPGIWEKYLEETLVCLANEGISREDKPEIADISFRTKRFGWKDYCFEFRVFSRPTPICESARENLYMHAFLRDWSLRPACYNCKAKKGASQADITMGDFWGIEKSGIKEDDDKGTSCIICRTKKAQHTINEVKALSVFNVDYDIILRGNPSLEESAKFTFPALCFQRTFHRNGFFRTMEKIERPSLFFRGIGFAIKKLQSLKNMGT